MATELEVGEIIGMLITLNLRPIPVDQVKTIKSYFAMLSDIPGPVLKQAAKNHALGSQFFPTVSELRVAAQQTVNKPGADAQYPPEIQWQVDMLTRKWQEQHGQLSDVDLYAWEILTWPYREAALKAAHGDHYPQTLAPELPPHPELHAWTDAAAWQEQERARLGIPQPWERP